MRIGQVVGKVVLSRVHPSIVGAQFKIVAPLTFSDLAEPDPLEAAQTVGDDESARGLDDVGRVAAATNRLTNHAIPRQRGNEIVVYDDCSAAIGEWLAFSEGAEAAAAFGPENPHPVDAFGGAIIDNVEIDAQVVAELVAAKNK